MPEVVIPSTSHSLSADIVMSSSRSNSSSKDIDVTSLSLVSAYLVLLEALVSLRVDMVDLVSKDEGENLKENKSY